jgi:hypothetical protein
VYFLLSKVVAIGNFEDGTINYNNGAPELALGCKKDEKVRMITTTSRVSRGRGRDLCELFK